MCLLIFVPGWRRSNISQFRANLEFLLAAAGAVVRRRASTTRVAGLTQLQTVLWLHLSNTTLTGAKFNTAETSRNLESHQLLHLNIGLVWLGWTPVKGGVIIE